MGAGLTKVHYTFSRIEHAFVCTCGRPAVNHSIIPNLSIEGIILIAFQGFLLLFSSIQLFSPEKFPSFLFLSCFLQGKILI